MDGNTRWCTVTAAAALQETFGTDGQPGSYTDIDCRDALFLFGHFKVAAVSVTRLHAGDGPAPAPDNTASAPAGRDDGAAATPTPAHAAPTPAHG